MFESEHALLWRSYRQCRAAFYLISIAMVLLCLDTGCFLIAIAGHFRVLWDILTHSYWRWFVGTAILVSSVSGMLMLVPCWKHKTWKLQASLLGLMALVDVGIWISLHAEDLHLVNKALDHEWFRRMVGFNLNWLEFGLTASLAHQIWTHIQAKPYQPLFDDNEAQPSFPGDSQTSQYVLVHHKDSEAGTPIWGFPLIGFAYSMVYYIHLTNWQKGWPLEKRADVPDDQQISMEILLHLLLVVGAWVTNRRCQWAIRRCSWEIADEKNLPDKSSMI